MNKRQTQVVATRVASLLASAAVTALVIGSQLGIADGYTRQADALLAAKNAQQPVAQHAASAPKRPS